MSKHRKTRKVDYDKDQLDQVNDYDEFDSNELQLTDRNIRNESPIKGTRRIVVLRPSDLEARDYEIRPIKIGGLNDPEDVEFTGKSDDEAPGKKKKKKKKDHFRENSKTSLIKNNKRESDGHLPDIMLQGSIQSRNSHRSNRGDRSNIFTPGQMNGS